MSDSKWEPNGDDPCPFDVFADQSRTSDEEWLAWMMEAGRQMTTLSRGIKTYGDLVHRAWMASGGASALNKAEVERQELNRKFEATVAALEEEDNQRKESKIMALEDRVSAWCEQRYYILGLKDAHRFQLWEDARRADDLADMCASDAYSWARETDERALEAQLAAQAADSRRMAAMVADMAADQEASIARCAEEEAELLRREAEAAKQEEEENKRRIQAANAAMREARLAMIERVERMLMAQEEGLVRAVMKEEAWQAAAAERRAQKALLKNLHEERQEVKAMAAEEARCRAAWAHDDAVRAAEERVATEEAAKAAFARAEFEAMKARNRAPPPGGEPPDGVDFESGSLEDFISRLVERP